MSKQRFLRSLYLWSNSSSLLSGALNLFYLRNNSSPLLSLDSIIGLLKELCLRHNSSPPTLLSSSSLLSSKLKLLLLLLLSSSSSSSSSPLLPILFLSLPSLAWSSSSFAWPRSCFTFASLILFALTSLDRFPIIGFWISIFFASSNSLSFWSSALRKTAWLIFHLQ